MSENNKSAEYSVVRSIGVGVSVIVALWGLGQILLYWDPFVAIHLSKAIYVSLVLLAVPLVTYSLGALIRRLTRRANNGGIGSGRIGRIIFRLESLVFGIPRDLAVATFVIAIFLLVLSVTTGVKGIEEDEIAKEELRASGWQLSMDSLQNALYFFDVDAIRLFRRAGVQTDDIYRALGQPHDFTEQKPLLLGVFDRLGESDSSTAEARAVSLVELLAKTSKSPPATAERDFFGRVTSLRNAFSRWSCLVSAQMRQDLQTTPACVDEPVDHQTLAVPFFLYDNSSGPRGGEPRTLLGYALEHQSGFVAGALLRESVSLPGTVRRGTDKAFHARGTSNAYAAALLDPWLALKYESGKPQPNALFLARSLCADGKNQAYPLQSTWDEHLSSWVVLSDEKDMSTSEKELATCFTQRPEPAIAQHLYFSQTLRSTIIAVDHSGNCSIVASEGTDALQTDWQQTQPSIWSNEAITSPGALASTKIVVQHQPLSEEEDYYRFGLLGDSNRLTGWNVMPSQGFPLAARFPLTDTVESTTAAVPHVTMFVHPAGDPTVETGRSHSVERWADMQKPITVTMGLSTSTIAVTRPVSLTGGSGVSVQMKPHRSDICLRIRRLGTTAEGDPSASTPFRYVAANETASLSLPFIVPDETLQLEAYRVSLSEDREVGKDREASKESEAGKDGETGKEREITLLLTPLDGLTCIHSPTNVIPPVQPAAPTWPANVKHTDRLDPGSSMLCFIESDKPANISIQLSEMSVDLDLYLHLFDIQTGNWSMIGESANGFTESDHIALAVTDGRFAIEVRSLDQEIASPFRLDVESWAINRMGESDEDVEIEEVDPVGKAFRLVTGMNPITRRGTLFVGQRQVRLPLHLPQPAQVTVRQTGSPNLLPYVLDQGDEPVTPSYGENTLLSFALEAGDYGLLLYRTTLNVTDTFTVEMSAAITGTHPIDKLDEPVEPNSEETLFDNVVTLGSGRLGQEGLETKGILDASMSAILYEFALPELALTTITLSDLSRDLDIELLRPDGSSIDSSVNVEIDDERISQWLDPGNYLVRISAYSVGTSSDYRLKVEASESDLPMLGMHAPLTISGWLDSVTSGAEHLFEVPHVTDVDVRLDKLLADADIALLPLNGTESLAFSANGDNAAETLSARLEPGRYRLEVTWFGGSATPYCLVVQAGPNVRELGCAVE